MIRLLWLCLFAAPLFALDSSNVLLVANSKVEGSVEIAEFYAEMRGVPKSQILKLEAPTGEEITREEFTKSIWEPVRKVVLENQKILCIVPTRGVPLKVRQQSTKPPEKDNGFAGRDFACVDSELMLALTDELKIDSAVENPLLEKDQHITREDKLLIVCRLDGPSIEIAMGLVEKALLAEACSPEGKSYLDTRGLTGNNGYTQRDDIMEKVEDSWKALAIPYLHDTKDEVLDLSTFEEPLHYYGWYAGSQTPKGKVCFRTGGIDVHLHSFSAATVRGPSHWVGPLLTWNATCTYGTVYEPYTVGFPYEHIFWARLSKGYCFGEAGMLANHLLSWQSVFVGDPLYTPYPEKWSESKTDRRAALAKLLVAKEAAAPEVDEALRPLFLACARLIKARVDKILAVSKTNIQNAIKLKEDLDLLLKDFGLDSAVGELLEPLNAALKTQLEEIRAQVKTNLTDTAGLEAALQQWRGLAIEKELLAFRDETSGKQEVEAAKLLKSAQGKFKSKSWLDAWKLAANARRYKFAPSASDARKLQDDIKADAKGGEKLLEAAAKEIKRQREAAQKLFDKKQYDKAKACFTFDVNDYPDCDEKTQALALFKQIEDKLKESPPKGK